MNYKLLNGVIGQLEEFEKSNAATSNAGIEEFKRWIAVNHKAETPSRELQWEGKENGRGADSVINTLIVHMNRYAKSYSRSAIFGSEFSSQEDFIYLINLRAFGEMTKMNLIKKNVHEKPAGMKIIDRLIAKGWVDQTDSEMDKRSKVLNISNKGIQVLEKQMDKIRKASEIVTGDLTYSEKEELIRLLQKLNDFHQPIYDRNIDPEYLLDEVSNNKRG